MNQNFRPPFAEADGGGESLDLKTQQYEDPKGGIEPDYTGIMRELSAIKSEPVKSEPGAWPYEISKSESPQLQRLEYEQPVTESWSSFRKRAELAPIYMHVNELADPFETKNQERRTTLNLTQQGQVAEEHEIRDGVAKLRGRIVQLEQEKVHLRSIILENVGKQKIVAEEDVITAFSELRQSVQQLANHPIFEFTTTPSVQLDNKSQRMRQFYAIIRELSPKDVRLRFREQIFEFLYRFVLSRTCFGLKRDGQDGTENSGGDIEDALVQFENLLLTKQKVNKAKVIEWRTATLDCIALLQIPDRYKYWVAERVYKFLNLMNSRSATPSQRDDLWTKTIEVCDKAIKLKHTMQRSTQGYTVHRLDLRKNPLYSNIDEDAECMGVEHGKAAEKSDEIAYVLFGSLVRYSSQAGREWKTLVKAEVILKRKSTGQVHPENVMLR